MLDALQKDYDDLAEELKEVYTDKKTTIVRLVSERKEVERQLGSLRTQVVNSLCLIVSFSLSLSYLFRSLSYLIFVFLAVHRQ